MVSIDGYEDVPVNDETALAKAATKQPVSVAICASEAMQFYSTGIIAAKGSCTGLNHGVLVAGYDVVSALPMLCADVICTATYPCRSHAITYPSMLHGSPMMMRCGGCRMSRASRTGW